MASSVSMPRRKKIAFVKRGLFSYSNLRTAEQLRRMFPEYDLEEIDVEADLLRHQHGILACNLASIVRRYWRELLTNRQTIRLCFYRTPYIFHRIRELIRAQLEPRRHEFAFTIQTQSLYDASIPGVPHFVYTDHTHLTNLKYPGFPREELFSRAWIDLERGIYRNADRVFVMSEHVRESLLEQYGLEASQSSCVYAGSNIDPSPASLNNGDFTNPTIVFIGIDWERKGGPVLLRAFEEVLTQIPNAKLLIIGGNPPVRHPHVEVIGRVSREKVKAHLVRGSVFCLPTRIEPFGIAVVEAFFHRLPVVVSNIGAMPNLVEEGRSGHLVQPDDPKALAKALIDLLSDPEKCRRFGEAGYQTVTDRYSWDAVGRRIRAGIDASLALRNECAKAA
jgi:glycosyltransferase involved in cell wall biosynthesis